MIFDLKKLKYTILTQESVKDPALYNLYCEAYEFWKKTWKNIFTKVGSPEAWSGDDFFRQDFIPVIMYDGKIIALHCSTVFFLKNPCLKDIKYFSIFSSQINEWMDKNKVQDLMSMEFLSVAKEWRVTRSGLSFAEILIGLGSKIVKLNNIDAAIGVSVKAAKITEKASKLNYSVISNEARRGNLICDVIGLIPDAHKHPDIQARAMIEYLWEDRIGEVNINSNSLLKAA
jgi:hypothetical protein